MTAETRFDVVIVGAGHAGAQAAIALRQAKFAGSIGLIGEEAELPYERPPLSKAYLAGEKPFGRLLIRPAAFWTERGVTLLPGERVVSVDPATRVVTTQAGRTISYGDLVWAAGGHARRLTCSGQATRGVHGIRDRADVDRLVAELPAARDVVVVGGGYIGLEAAAVLTKLGKRVTIVEAQDRVLARVAGEALSRFFEAEHRARGVTLLLGAGVGCIEERDCTVSGVRLVDGTLLPAQIVIVGIGIAPAVAPLLDAGAAGGDGVLVDDRGRTSLPHVFAAGDCALHPNAFADGATIRIESVQNAHDQANVVARVIAGEDARYAAVPWFWSEQFDLRLQTVGLSAGHDQAVLRGAPAARSFSIVYLKRGRVIALDCINATRDYAQGRALVLAGAHIPAERLADPAIPLKDLAPALERT